MKNVKAQLLFIFLIGMLFSNQSFAQSTDEYWADDKAFCLSDEEELARIWGKSYSIPRVYFKERLPAFFKRRLVFSKSNFKTSQIEWIFTGPKGGITATISSDTISLEQRYYDSFGFNKVKGGKILSSRYAQSQFTDFKAAIADDKINSVTLEINHGLGLKLYINDVLVNEQTTQIDISQHQLAVNGLNMDVCGTLQVPKVSTVMIKLDIAKKHQKILGFGGITSPIAYNLLSDEGKEKWWGFLKEYNLLIQREYPIGSKLKEDFSNWDNLDDATPHYYGDNFPNGEVSDFEYNKKIQALNGMVVFEFWHFPGWMMNRATGKKKGVKVEPFYDKYAAAMINYCETAKQKTGKAPAILGIQNEVVQNAEIWQKLTEFLRKALDEKGFKDVKIHMHNSSQLFDGINALKAFTAKKEIWEKIDYSASNLYDYQNHFTNPDGFDKVITEWNDSHNGQAKKQFISTEMCVNYSRYQSGSYRVAFLMGELYHKNMVDMDAVSLMYCWLLVNTIQSNFSASRSLFTIDKSRNNLPKASSCQLRVFGAYSRHLPEGTERIEASSTDEDILVSAYSNENKNIIIVTNRGVEPKKIDIEGFGNVTIMEVVSPYHENQQIQISDKNQLIIEPGNIITFY